MNEGLHPYVVFLPSEQKIKVLSAIFGSRARWFALLLAEEKELSEREKTGIFQSHFRAYLGWVKDLSRKLNMNKGILERIFMEEMQ